MRKERPRKDFKAPVNTWQQTLKMYRSFDDYVRDYPEAECYRALITRSTDLSRLIIFESPVRAFSGSLPGSFYWIEFFKRRDGLYYIRVEGCDDCCLEKCIPEKDIDNEIMEITTQEFYTFKWFEENGYVYGD